MRLETSASQLPKNQSLKSATELLRTFTETIVMTKLKDPVPPFLPPLSGIAKVQGCGQMSNESQVLQRGQR